MVPQILGTDGKLDVVPCYHPITAFQPHGGGPLSFHQKNDHNELQIPCGQCYGCRLKRSRDWAIRCMHEKQMHRYNCMLTLTYDDQKTDPGYSLQYEHFQAFMRKLRKARSRALRALQAGKDGPPLLVEKKSGLRFYVGGEYGPERGRPHFHACIFGLDFEDRIYYKKTPAGSKLYTSPTLEKLWGKGFASIGDITFESAAYIARYLMKKRTGDGNRTNYNIIDPETGEIYKRKKEFNNMSRRPGVGSTWFDKYQLDAYPHGKVLIRGHQAPTPRYYDKRFKATDELAFEDLQYARWLEATAQQEHHTPERLAVQEEVAIARTRSLQRKLN